MLKDVVDILNSLDDSAYNTFDDWMKNSQALAAAMRLGDQLGSYVAVGVVLAIALLLLVVQGRPRAAQLGLAAAALGIALVEMVRRVVPAQRPDAALHLVGDEEMWRSFPAGKMLLFTLAAALLLFTGWSALHRKTAKLLLTTALVTLCVWVALSQLMLALHFVSDVLAGVFAGLVLAMIANRLSPSAAPTTAQTQL